MSNGRTRAGVRLLLMAADPVNRRILQEMTERPFDAGPGQEYRVTAGGREVLFVGHVLERWLQGAPSGPLSIGSQEAERAVAALAEAWSTTVMHALAREALTFDELHDLVEEPSKHALIHLLSELNVVGLTEEHEITDSRVLFAMTDWLRAGIAAFIASARFERREPQEGMAPIDALDVEAGFRCSLRFVELPRQLSGTCSLGINLEDDESGCLTGVTARIELGQVVSCKAGLDGKADAWAAGTAADWLDAVVEPDAQRVRTGGDKWLTRAVVGSLHEVLFGTPVV